MKILLLTLSLILYCIILKAQVSCEQMMKDAAIADSNRKYQDAILRYTAAENCNPKLTEKANEKILLIFNKIEKLNEDVRRQKDSAITAKNEALREKAKADSLKDVADKSLISAKSLNKVFEARELLDADPTQALVLADSAVDIDSSAAAYDALFKAYFNSHYNKIIIEKNVSKLTGLDATQMVAGYMNGAIKIIHTAGSDSAVTLKSHNANVNDIYAAHDTIFSCADDKSIIIQTTNKKIFKTLENLPSVCKIIRRSPSGFMVTGSVDGVIRFYDIKHNLQLVKELQDSNLFEIKDIFFSGDCIYAISTDGVWCWNYTDSNNLVFNKYYFNIQKAVFNAENKTMLIAYDSRHIAILNSEGKEIASKQLMARVIDVINLGNNKTFIEFETGDTRTINASLQGLDNGKIEQNDQLALIGNDIVTIKDSILKFWNADQFLFKPDNLTRFGILIDTINNFNIINAGKYYTYITIKTGNDTLKFEKEYSNEISAGDVSITFKTDSAAIGASSAIIYLSKNDINITEIDRVKFKIEEFYTESSNRYFLIAGKTRNEFFYLYPLPAFIRSAVKTAQTNPATKN